MMMNENLFAKIYLDPRHPAGFSSKKKLLHAAQKQDRKIKPADLSKWLRGQPTYTLHKPARKRFPRRQTVSNGIDYQWQIDLVSMQNVKRHNDGYNYLMTIIDVFSRYAWVIPLKTKQGTEVANALERLFSQEKRQPKYLQSDLGGEFINTVVLKLLKAHNIDLFSVDSDTKCALVERFNRTLKMKMYRYFTHHNTFRFIEVLPDLVASYNNTIHRSINMAPENQLWKQQYADAFSHKKKFAFNKGDTVRISQIPKTFDKGYIPRWTREYFTVVQRMNTLPPTYKVRDEQNNVITGSFYEQEMQVISHPSQDDLYEIDVLKKRKRKNKREYFVHYRGWPASYDEWVSAVQLKKLT
jgi:hypothetical protein